MKSYLGVVGCTPPPGEPAETGVGDSRIFSVE